MNQVNESDLMALAIESLVVSFMRKMGQDISPDDQAKLVAEEARELVEAYDISAEAFTVENVAAFLKELADLMYVLAGLAVVCRNKRPTDFVFKTLADLDNVEKVIKLTDPYVGPEIMLEAVYRVHKSNMSKLGADGKPLFNDEGKVLKGPNYTAPDLSDLAERVVANVMGKALEDIIADLADAE